MTEPTIRRATHDKNYTCISNTVLQNEDLSWKARGLLVYLLSLPDNWRIYVSELANRAPDGKDATRTAFKELQTAGYITGEQQKGENGHYLPISYIVHEKPNTENPDAENPPLQSTHEPSTHEKKNTPSAVAEQPNANSPANFEDWLDELKQSKNKQAVIARMIYTLFPAKFPQGIPKNYYGRVAKTAKHSRIQTYERLAQLTWQANGYRPTGDVLAYVIGLAQGSGREPPQKSGGHPGDKIVSRDGKTVVRLGQ